MKQIYSFILMTMTGVLSINAQFLEVNSTTDWNRIWKSGFYESVDNTPNAPISDRWCWGINIAFTGNNEYDRENSQIIIKDDPSMPAMFFRNTDESGEGRWAEVIHSLGFQTIDGDLTINGQIKAKEIKAKFMETNKITDWNNIWESGIFQSEDHTPNSPVSDRWCWGINFAFTGNNEFDKENCQIVIKDEPYSPCMYFRNTDEKGRGTWAEVIHNLGNQTIHGNLTVGGSINAKEITVTPNAGADFVFDPDYPLKDLSEIKGFVERNRHLPGIQSEKQMLEDGVNMNEFQIQLLQKIEELTLYVIKQQEEINELKSQIKK